MIGLRQFTDSFFYKFGLLRIFVRKPVKNTSRRLNVKGNHVNIWPTVKRKHGVNMVVLKFALGKKLRCIPFLAFL
ncbi:MAG: hypothetical protein A2107_07405 [Verrucomicrobia bacterium GWF2_62_7]|nr:MAG: hypothetical protein A2107_07405 [Verrucomicrobia bacterium GWF2_62_7]